MAQTQTQLVKFCTAEAAKQVLQNLTLRWSSPHLFDDPFELNHNSPLGVDKQTLLPTAIKVASGMIFSRDSPKGETPLINAIRRWREEDRFQNPEEAEGVLRELLDKMVDARFAAIDLLMSKWLNYNRKLRICCFCSKLENPLAWQKFADNHRGVAIRFHISDDAYFKLPQAVEYTNTFTELTTIKEQVGAIISNQKDHTADRFPTLHNHKPLFFKAEQEWRCKQYSPNTAIATKPAEWFDDIAFEASDVQGICLGMNIKEEESETISALANKNVGHAKMYKIMRSKGSYNLELAKR